MRTLLLLALLLCVACDDSGVFDPGALDVPANTSPRFTADASPGGKAITLAGQSMNATDLDLIAVAAWTDAVEGPLLTTADLLLRIDPAAHAEVIDMQGGTWCGLDLPSVTPTGNPGEWRIKKSADADDCTCSNEPDPWGYGSGSGPHQIGRIRVRIHEVGTWRVELAAGSHEPVCDCNGSCPSDIVLSGGSVTDR